MFFRLHLISKTRVLREFSALVSVSVIVSVDILKLHISEASQLAYKKALFSYGDYIFNPLFHPFEIDF